MGMRITPATVKVLQALMEAPAARYYGYALMRATRLKSGSLYPILERLESAGWVDSQWEEIDETKEGRPPRRYYQLTALGQECASQAIDDFFAQFGVTVTTGRSRLGRVIMP
jgi:PadR family transcriptional regulator, regulatory protein PadR